MYTYCYLYRLIYLGLVGVSLKPQLREKLRDV